jgi:Na+-transporting methylmalonyl-CoA/oxaloacetate decarboxylase gamma subunit
MEVIDQGLQVSIYGIVITFLALGVLILVVTLLQAIFPSRLQEKETIEMKSEPLVEGSEEEQDSRLVALTAAWWYWQNKKSSSLGKQLEKGPGKRWRKTDKA